MTYLVSESCVVYGVIIPLAVTQCSMAPHWTELAVSNAPMQAVFCNRHINQKRTSTALRMKLYMRKQEQSLLKVLEAAAETVEQPVSSHAVTLQQP